MYYTAFFFSSRRRHTRFDCDWSSDVCSSDLPPERAGERFHKTSQAAAKGTAKPSVVPRQGAIPFGVRIPDRNRKPRWDSALGGKSLGRYIRHASSQVAPPILDRKSVV